MNGIKIYTPRPQIDLSQLREQIKEAISDGKKIISHYKKLEEYYSEWEDRLNEIQNKVNEAAEQHNIPVEQIPNHDILDDAFIGDE